MFSASKTAAPSGGAFPIQRSLRFRSSASAYLTRTPSSTTNRQTMTFSFWLKRGALSTIQNIYNATDNVTASSYFYFNASDVLLYTDQVNSTQLTTTQVFRDPSAWYHFVFAIDTTQATAANRVKLYVNGVQITSFSTATYPAQNSSTGFNYTSFKNDISSYWTGSGQFFDGYMTEINFIDGQALTPTSFGSYNATTGVWQTKAYAGSYGTNGFYLNFQDNSAATAAAIGKDSSGNGNNWTPNNISVTAGVTYDSMTDVPTLTSATAANFCTFNPLILRYSAGTTFSEANLKATGSSAYAWGTTNSGLTGKYYWEMTVTAGTSVAAVGVDDGIGQTSTPNANFVVYLSNGQKTINATSSAYGASYTTGDIIGVALNMDTGAITFYKNNTSQGAISNAFTAGVLPHVECGGSWAFQANFGQRPFTYTPPTGFVALNTYNLPTPTIPNGAAQFAATTYTGTGSSLTIANTVNSVNFQPDFVWVKGRSGATDHALYDSVRGTTKQLESNTTTAETTEATGLTAFGSTGFTVGALAQMNTNTATYVAWQWKASNTTAVTNTSGSITSSVSANPTAGFSIVTYTGTGSNATVGHGLGIAPKMLLVKYRNVLTGNDWDVYHSNLTSAAYRLYLNQTSAQVSAPQAWNSTAPTSTVFSIGTGSDTNNSATNYVAYCFAEIAGFSKFGSYTGNGSADGPFIYTGFRPRWIMIKSSTGVESWYVYDSSRNTYNVADSRLYPNLSSAEGTGGSYGFDLLSNGFKPRTSDSSINLNGGTYIYAAFAENPFNYSLAR